MEKITTIFQNLTFFQWLALVAFCFATISVFNAFFSLKSRYRDWRGTKSKKKFDERIKELASQLFELERHRNHPTVFFIRVLLDASRVAFLFICAFILFIISSLQGEVQRFLFGSLAVAVLVFTASVLLKLALMIGRMYEPEDFAIQIIDFVRSASVKGLTSTEADELIKSLATCNVFTEKEHTNVMGYIARTYPKPVIGLEVLKE